MIIYKICCNLIIFSVTEISEGEEYEVLFESAGKSFALKVYLSPDFPQDKPTLKILPIVIHSWISGDGEVTAAPGLLNVRIFSKYWLWYCRNYY